MDGVLNKIKSAVTNVLHGNPLSREFDIFEQTGSAGPGLVWKIFAVTKKSSKEQASVHLLEKRSAAGYSRPEQDAILDRLRYGVQQLTKLRHPKILAVIHPLEESREALAFATEPVVCSLSDFFRNMASGMLSSYDGEGSVLYDVEIKHGLLQVTEALAFLHNDAKIVHRNVSPEVIVVTKSGAWKLSGFDYCIRSVEQTSNQPLYTCQALQSDMVALRQPNLDFTAPEYVLGGGPCSPAGDMFSLGLLICTLFSKGKSFFQCHRQQSSFKEYTERPHQYQGDVLEAMPEELTDLVKLLLSIEPTARPDALQLAKATFFRDVGCGTLQYLDSLFQRQNVEKSNFFKGLPKVLTTLPKRVNIHRILPPLYRETVNPDMVPFLLSSILYIADQTTDSEYNTHIFPHLIPLFQLTEPVQVTLMFLQNMRLLLSRTSKQDTRNHLLPILFRSLDTDNSQLQELCLGILPTSAELIDFPTLKNSVLPRIKKLCLSTSLLMVRVNCLLCIGRLMERMDKWLVLDEVLPFLPGIPTREPAVLMSILGIHRVSFEAGNLGIPRDVLAGKVLPFLLPLSMDSSLSLSQFNTFMSVIRDMLDKVEAEQRNKLGQLEELKREHGSLDIGEAVQAAEDLIGPELTVSSRPQTMMDKFLANISQTIVHEGNVISLTTDRKNVPYSSSYSSPHQTVTSTLVYGPNAKSFSMHSGLIAAKGQLSDQQNQHPDSRQHCPDSRSPVVCRQPVYPHPVMSTGCHNPAVISKRNVKDLTSTLIASSFNSTRFVPPQSSASIIPSKIGASLRPGMSGTPFSDVPVDLFSVTHSSNNVSPLDGLLPYPARTKGNVPMNQMFSSKMITHESVLPFPGRSLLTSPTATFSTQNEILPATSSMLCNSCNAGKSSQSLEFNMLLPQFGKSDMSHFVTCSHQAFQSFHTTVRCPFTHHGPTTASGVSSIATTTGTPPSLGQLTNTVASKAVFSPTVDDLLS